MVLQFDREQYERGRFRYVTYNHDRVNTICFEKMNDGNIVLHSNNLNEPFELQIYPFFKTTVKSDGEIKQLAGDFSLGTKSKGLIYYCGKKGTNFLNGIYYWTFEIANTKYIAYEVGFGRKGIYLCVWGNEMTKAIVSKDVHTKRFESKYSIFIEDEAMAEIATICSLFWDLTRYYPSGSSEEFYTLNTWQKELKNKYDSGFIERVVSHDN